ncbi:TRAP transporter large permease subunit [Chloroflexota bacterium]
MWAPKLSIILAKVIDPLARCSTYLALGAMAVMTLTVVLDVTLRYLLRKPLAGSIEIVGLALIIVVFGAFALAELRDEHIKAEVIIAKLPPTVQKILITNGYFLAIGISILISWRTFVQAEWFRASNTHTGMLGIPEWPFMVLASLLVGLLTLAFLISFLNSLGKLLSIMKGIKAYLWLLPGIILALGLFVLSMRPELLPFEVTRGTWGGIIAVLLFVLIFLRVPIFVAMAVTALFGMSYLVGAEGSLWNLSMAPIDVATNYTWSVIPLFVWMGLLVFHTGFAKELYEVSYKWVGHTPGGLASSSVIACAGLAAVTGHSNTGVLTMGVIALPQMRAHNYDDKLSTATICAASTIGCLIPPSVPFIIYGMLTWTSIGKLFIAGIFPGILFAGMLMLMIYIRCRINPKLGPAGPKSSWKERFVSIRGIWAVALLVVVVLGGIYAGVFTPTEAGAIGSFGAVVIGLVRRRLSFKALTDSMIDAVRISAIVMIMFLFAVAFGRFITITNLAYDLAESIVALNLSPYVLLGIILLIYIFLGCVMNAAPVLILTLPIFFPIVMAAGFDPILFGVLIVVMVDLAVITPPIGANVFTMVAIVKDVPMYDIFRGLIPFFVLMVILVIVLVAFPQISLFLPSLMR